MEGLPPEFQTLVKIEPSISSKSVEELTQMVQLLELAGIGGKPLRCLPHVSVSYISPTVTCE